MLSTILLIKIDIKLPYSSIVRPEGIIWNWLGKEKTLHYFLQVTINKRAISLPYTSERLTVMLDDRRLSVVAQDGHGQEVWHVQQSTVSLSLLGFIA